MSRTEQIEDGAEAFDTVGSYVERIWDVDSVCDWEETGSLALLRKALYEASSDIKRVWRGAALRRKWVLEGRSDERRRAKGVVRVILETATKMGLCMSDGKCCSVYLIGYFDMQIGRLKN